MKIGKKNYRLYAITDQRWLNGRNFYEQIEAVLQNGATFLQLREKHATHEQIVDEAKIIKKIAKKYNVPFVINDDCLAAKEADVDGVHIGQSDISYEKARKILGPDKIIGMTAKTVEQAKLAQKLGADYIGVGAVFHTDTKADAVDMTKETLLEITKNVSIPVVAIGGITYENCDYLENTGVSGVAVISAIFAQDDMAGATKAMSKKTSMLFYADKTCNNIIFDLDGTILDSMPYWKRLAREYVEERGLLIPSDFDEKMYRKSVDEAAQYLHDEVKIKETKDEIKNDILSIIGRHYEMDIPLKKGIKELLANEYENKTRMCIFTASDSECAKKALQRLDIDKYFETIYTVDQIGINKHDKASYKKVCELAGYEPDETCVYEDAVHGLKSAKDAGFKTVAVYDYISENDWPKAKSLADEIFI